jgi:hypothetical protein
MGPERLVSHCFFYSIGGEGTDRWPLSCFLCLFSRGLTSIIILYIPYILFISMSPLRIATNANLFVLYYNNPVASRKKGKVF